MIKYYKNIEIDKTKWDRAVENSYNRLPFALSWYLDIVSPGWDALISDDYEEVMPVTKRRKFGILYLCQPPLCPRLGVFSSIHKEKFCVDEYLMILASRYSILEIAFNEKNFISTSISNNIETVIKLSQEQRFEPSNKDFQIRYSKSHKKNISKFIKDSGCEVLTDNSYLDFYLNKVTVSKEIGFKWDRYGKRLYLEVLKKLSEKDKIKILYGVDESKNIIGGICLLKYDFDRYSFQTFSSDKGKKKGLIFFLIDKIFNENTDKIIDFMGSNIPGVRYRNLGFGCSEIQYTFVKKNSFRLVLKRIKEGLSFYSFNK